MSWLKVVCKIYKRTVSPFRKWDKNDRREKGHGEKWGQGFGNCDVISTPPIL